MTEERDSLSVHQKLLDVQSEIKVPKNQYNKFGKYNYRSCEDILEAAKPLLKKNSCILSISDEIKHIEGRFYVEARAVITDCESGDSFQVTAYAREEESKKGMDGAQVTGSTSSYARKYALNGLFALDDNKDSDDTNKHGKNGDNKATTDKPQEDTKPKTQSQQQLDQGKVQRLAILRREKGITEEQHKAFLDKARVTTSKSLTEEQYKKYVEWLEKQPSIEKREEQEATV